jgi:cell division protein ZapA (FtsZ GTPase activity inhibitor)
MYDEKMFIVKFFMKTHKLTHYKIMTFFVTITHNIIIVVVLDLLTNMFCQHGCHMALLDINDKFDIKLKLKIIVKVEIDRN